VKYHFSGIPAAIDSLFQQFIKIAQNGQFQDFVFAIIKRTQELEHQPVCIAFQFMQPVPLVLDLIQFGISAKRSDHLKQRFGSLAENGYLPGEIPALFI
jgi:hypothetical protein